ncbi:hypothetical protein F5B20DRAFT_577334 [Whalleya microplaca]|nr:hypothetical protein F5B20DRAFT_577334 [Whalleya microplaca]
MELARGQLHEKAEQYWTAGRLLEARLAPQGSIGNPAGNERPMLGWAAPHAARQTFGRAQFTDVASINDNDFERSGNLQDLHSLRKARPFIFPGPPPIFLQHRSFRDGGTVPNSLAAEEQGADGGLGRVVRRPYVIAHSADGNAGPSRRRPHHSSNDNDEQPVAGRNLCFCGAGLLQQFQIRRSLWATSCSMMDTKMTVRFLVVIFNFFLGVAVIFSFKVAPARPDTALPSLDDDSYPIMVAQVAGSLLSPLLFSIVSVKGGLPPLRQRLGSCYFLLLVLGVLMSAVTLLLYVLCPSNYRFTNATMIASLEFTVLGSWQFLEKRWKKASEASVINDDIESGGPRDS